MNTQRRIDRESPVPYYFQLKQILLALIEGGEYEPGDKLQSEQAMCAAYDVSRTVVRQALNSLESEGVLRKRKGQGTFVAPAKVAESLFQSLNGLHEDVTARGGTLTNRVRRLERESASGPVAAELELGEGEPVIALERLRFVDGVPWVLVTTYMPYELCPQLLEEDMSERSLYALIEEEYGIYISYGRRSIEAVPAAPAIAEQLQMEEGDPVLMLRSTSYAEDNRPIEHFVAYHRGDHTRFEVTLARRRGSASIAGATSLPNVIASSTDASGTDAADGAFTESRRSRSRG